MENRQSVLPREKEHSKWACRKIEQQKFKECAEKLDSPILEIGPGYGNLMTFLKNHGKNIVGLEYNPEVSSLLSKKGLSIVNGDVRKMDFYNNQFDAVIIEEVIEHIPEQNAAMNEIFRVLRPGGTLLLATPNKWIYRFFMYISNIINLKFSFNLIKNPTPDHVSECSLDELKKIHHKFTIDKIIPINPYIPGKILAKFPKLAINFIIISHKE